MKSSNSIILAIIIVLVVGTDQVAKHIVTATIPLYGCVNIIPDTLNIIHIKNPGGAFGIMSQSPSAIRNFLFICASCVSIIIIVYFHRSLSPSYRLFPFWLALIVGGGISNTIDRVRFCGVIDFIDFSIFSYHWPAFNIADSAITIGITVLISYFVFKKIPDEK